MASSTAPGHLASDWNAPSPRVGALDQAWDVLRAAGSLKITVSMFLAATFLLFVGTLAQDEKNLPEVKAEYFNSWVARIPFADFFPVTIFGESHVAGWFPFPGGATIGLVLLVNLVAAKVTRFHAAARGRRLLWGTILCAVGGCLALAVILTGHRSDGLQGRPPVEYATVWRILQAMAAAGTLGLVVAAVRGHPRKMVRLWLFIASIVAILSTALMLFGGNGWRMNEPGLRIMWQLMQSSAASLVLLGGLVMVFGHRGGNVLIHLAVGLLMVGQFAFGDRQIEERMTLVEGQSTTMACRIDETELAIATPLDPGMEVPAGGSEDGARERVTAISGRLLAARAGGKPIVVEDLPFDIHVIEYFVNSGLGRPASTEDPADRNPATTGIGSRVLATPRPPEGGASSRTNIASAYVRLVERDGGRDLGTHLVTQFLNDQSQLFMVTAADECDTVTADDRDWRLQLRFRREYKPYSVSLDDVRRINYSASDTPRDYSSYVTFSDTATGSQQKGRIWMNNPVRYRGETFYQSQYSEVDLGDGRTGEQTGLQVVENAGWLVPYVACVLAFWGMLAHFGGTFLRFADRYEREGLARSNSDLVSTTDSPTAGRADRHPGDASPRRAARRGHLPAGRTAQGRSTDGRGAGGSSDHDASVTHGRDWLIPVLAVGLVAVLVLPSARSSKPTDRRADWQAAGRLPAMHEGRIKPLDSVARTTLQLLGNRTSVVMPDEGEGPHGKVSATQWMLAVMAGSEWAARAPVFRIDAFEVLDLFDLTRRKGNRYSAVELEKGRAALNEQIAAARDVPPESRTFFQKKCGEINQKLMAYDLLRMAYDTPRLPTPPQSDDEASRRAVLDEIRRLLQGSRLIDENHPPALVPPSTTASAPTGDAADGQVEAGSSRWQALYPALVTAMVKRMVGETPDNPSDRVSPVLLPLVDLLGAVDGPADSFNRKLADLENALEGLPASREVLEKARFEAWFNTFNPTDLAKWLYVLSMVLCFASFLAWHAPLNRFVTWMLLATLAVHTFAIWARIAITGRPPVVNLYSSAVFIGWACVLAGLGLESLYRMGIGNLAASLAGALTLMVAYGLDTGDTMHVLQAVLDTQFWLSTHVVTVTLGYGATFLAGLLGTCAIVHRGWLHFTTWRPASLEHAHAVQTRLYRMTYGVVCFALFFSFIGTVLGGLWADDSWGRFWGWDPKENGALMIVLWNAAVLHARWDGWIGPRGFALFAIGGNVVTAWSWFGTNQLGIGLHSYGFTSGVLMLLAAYVTSQLVLITAGLFLPRRLPAVTPG